MGFRAVARVWRLAGFAGDLALIGVATRKFGWICLRLAEGSDGVPELAKSGLPFSTELRFGAE